MAIVTTNNARYSDIADAIRGKNGSSAQYTPAEMAAAITAITTSPPERKDVNFYDYDGTLLYSYTIAEANALGALPTQPTHTGLTGQGWNYTLALVNATTMPMDVGAIYITDDGKTRLYIEFPSTLRTTVPVYFSQTVSNGVTFNWGDGSPTQTVSGTGNLNVSHTYATAGVHCISLQVTSGTLGFGNGSSNTPLIGYTSDGYRNMLKRAEIGTGVPSITSYAFYGAYLLQSVTIPTSVSSLASRAFALCMSMLGVVIPYGVTSIPSYSFDSCFAIQRIVIPNSVTSTNNYSFGSCYALQSIVIPSSVTNIAAYSFNNCFLLWSLTMSSNATTIGPYAFTGCRNIQVFTFPSGLTAVSDYVLSYGYSIQIVVVPSSATSIGQHAFTGCALVKEYHFLSTAPPTLADVNAFTAIAADCTFYVPLASLDAYKTASRWIAFASRMVGE